MLIVILISFILLIGSVFIQIPLAYTLILCWLLFCFVGKRDYGWSQLLKFSWSGARTSFVVIRVLLAIGALIGIWMNAGMIANIVVSAFQFTNPTIFLLLSSSASLVSAITYTKLFDNIRQMFKTSWIAIILCIVFFGVLSLFNPLSGIHATTINSIHSSFAVTPIMLIPVLIIVIMSILKQPIISSILVSILVAFILGLLVQRASFQSLIASLIFGFHNSQKSTIIQGGGVISMVNPMSVVFVSCAIAGVLNELSGFKTLKSNLTSNKISPSSRFVRTILVSFVTSAIGCNQSVAIIMTNTLVADNYDDQKQLAAELENSSVLIAPLVPWNIAVYVPIAMINANFITYLPYAAFLYFVPLIYWLSLKFKG